MPNFTKMIFSLAVLLCALGGGLVAEASKDSSSDTTIGFLKGQSLGKLRSLPIMHEGRVKPFETFARTHLLTFSGKSRVDGLDASQWLLGLLIDPEAINQLRIFHVPNPDLVATLKLHRHVSNRYSFQELFPRIQENLDQIRTVSDIPPDKRTLEQRHLMQVQAKAGRYFELAGSLQGLLPSFEVNDPALAAEYLIEPGKKYHFLEIARIAGQVREAAQALPEVGTVEALNPREQDVLRLATAFAYIESWPTSPVFRIVPPQWQTDSSEWHSVWTSVSQGTGSPKSAEYFQGWKHLALAAEAQDSKEFAEASKELTLLAGSLGPVDSVRLQLEVFYNRAQLDVWAIAFFILSFLLVLVYWALPKAQLQKISQFSLWAGLIALGAAICIRMYLMGRPPVTTLYESVLFVAFVVGVFSLWLEARAKNGLGLLVGSVSAVVLLFVSFGYAAEGDTLGVLVAVLNTNFWLATHVVCMTIGYGTCLVAGMLGHVYLIARTFKKTRIRLNDLYRNMVGMSLVALFFSLFGTILGGIWADQSWGRFWGWDPKENGAMLVVLWLLFMLHGRLGGQVRALGYALGMVFSNIIVALAWFGVNLLSVGLHSYGFTENIAINLLVFCLAEAAFGLGFYHWAKINMMETKLTELESKILPRSQKLETVY